MQSVQSILRLFSMYVSGERGTGYRLPIVRRRNLFVAYSRKSYRKWEPRRGGCRNKGAMKALAWTGLSASI